MTLFLALVVGVIFGAIVTALRLPLPAPNALPGIVAIFGVYLGALIVGWL